MVHNNPTMLNCFIKQLLQYQGSVVFIHVDEKGLNIIPDIIEDPRVIIIPEHYNGSWGDYSQIQMVNALIKNAVNSGDFDYYSLHSGVDLCVREVSEFADYLSKNNLYGFYECTKLPSTWQYGGGLGRVALKWPKYLRRRAVGYAEKCRIPERRASHNDRDSYPAVSCTGAYQCSDLPGNEIKASDSKRPHL